LVNRTIWAGQGARQLGDGHIGTALRDEFDYFVKLFGLRLKLALTPSRDAMSRRAWHRGRRAGRQADIVERWLVALGLATISSPRSTIAWISGARRSGAKQVRQTTGVGSGSGFGVGAADTVQHKE